MATKKISKQKEQEIQNEILRLGAKYDYDPTILQEFARFVLYGKQPLSLTELKQAIYDHFNVKTTPELRKVGMFTLAVSGMGKLNYSKTDTWEKFYRKFIGILPHEKNETGRGCINGINIFKYNMPWQIFGLDPQTASTEDVKASYRRLSKIYHPDNPETGDAEVFHKLTIFYESLTERF